MTDISATAPIKFSAVRDVRLRAPLLVIGRSIGTLLQACSEALELAYVAPCAGPARRKGPAP